MTHVGSHPCSGHELERERDRYGVYCPRQPLSLCRVGERHHQESPTRVVGQLTVRIRCYFETPI